MAVLEDGQLVEIHVERPETQRAAGNIYRAKVENVLPGMQAAFVDIGLEKNAFLYVADAVPAVNFEEIEGEGAPKPRRGLAISKMLRPGQKVIVQVIKDPIGSKGARVSAYVTLPGHYVVLMPNVDYVGVSRRISDAKERQRLRQGVAKVKPRGMGVIVRTAADGHDIELIKTELTYLHNVWRKISGSRAGSAPKLLHRDLGLVGRVVRDLLSAAVTRIVVDSPDTHAQVAELVREAAPDLAGRLELYPPGKQELFAAHGIEAELNRAIQRRVWLKSGGYLVVDETEAFTVFDVNTGRYVGSTSLAMTVLDINLESAAEIARQLRLRDIGGIIIIDFIDMESAEHRQRVISKLEQSLARDRTRSHVLGLTELGLVEMTRKKVRQSLGDMLTKICPCCEGRGKILSEATMASRVRREMRELLRTSDAQALLVEVHPAVAAVLIGAGGQRLRELERETGKVIYVRGSDEQPHEGFRFRQFASKDEVQAAALPVRTGDILDLRVEEQHASNAKDGIARVEGFVLDIVGGAEFVGERVKVKVAKVHRTYAEAEILGEAEPLPLMFDQHTHVSPAGPPRPAVVGHQAVVVATPAMAVIATPQAAALATAGAAAAVTAEVAVAAVTLAQGDPGPEGAKGRPGEKKGGRQKRRKKAADSGVQVAKADKGPAQAAAAEKLGAGVAQQTEEKPPIGPDAAGEEAADQVRPPKAARKPRRRRTKAAVAVEPASPGVTAAAVSDMDRPGTEQESRESAVDPHDGAEQPRKVRRRRGGRSKRGGKSRAAPTAQAAATGTTGGVDPAGRATPAGSTATTGGPVSAAEPADADAAATGTTQGGGDQAQEPARQSKARRSRSSRRRQAARAAKARQAANASTAAGPEVAVGGGLSAKAVQDDGAVAGGVGASAAGAPEPLPRPPQ